MSAAKAGGGAPKRKLTSKNLFDDVFAGIPATSYLRYGPQSVLEELAMLDDADSARKAGSSAVVTGGDGDDDDVFLLNDGPAAPSSSSDVAGSASSPWVTVEARRVGGGTRRTPGSGGVGTNIGVQLEVDAEDEAIREATKHTALLTEFGQAQALQDAEAVERRRQRLAQQVAAMRGAEDTRTAQQQQQQGAYARSGGAGSRMGLHGDTRDGRDRQRGTASAAFGEGGGGEQQRERGVAAQHMRGGEGALTTGAEGQQQQQLPVSVRLPMTAEEQLALMPPGLSRLYTGSCVMLRASRGYGFIAPDLGGPDVYFTKDSVVLTFTRLALQAFYAARGMDCPASTALPAERWDAPELTGDADARAPLVVSQLSDLSRGQKPIEPVDPAATTTTTTTTTLAEGAPTVADVAATTVEPSLEQPPATTTAERAPPSAPEKEKRETLPTAATAHPSPGASVVELSLHSRPLPGALTTAVMMTTQVMGGVDANPVPPITAQERARAAQAAALLTTETAQLLQWALDNTMQPRGGDGVEDGSGVLGSLHGAQETEGGVHGGGDPGGVVVAMRDPLTFTVQRNRATGGGSRLLRAEFIRGSQAACFALPLEQSWFYPLFPGAVGVKASEYGEGGAAADSQRPGTPAEAGPLLVRYTGSVRAYNAEDCRGYIRCDEPGVRQDVCFYSSAFLWDPSLPPAEHLVSEQLKVRYSVAGVDRNGKYLATLVTSFKDGRPFTRDSFVFVEDEREARGGRRGGGAGVREELEGGGMLRSSASTLGAGEGGSKRARAEAAEEQMLLFEEDDYAMI